MGSYFQQEAAFIDGGARWKALFPGFRVRGCCAVEVLPGRLILVGYKTQKDKGVNGMEPRGLIYVETINY